MPTKWSDDAFLDDLRRLGDAEAEACVAQLSPNDDLAWLFRQMDANVAPVPADAPEPIRRFFAEVGSTLPQVGGAAVDQARLDRGAAFFLTRAFPSALILLARSIPEGYAAARLTAILTISDELKHHPYRRLLGVLQMLINVNARRAFEPSGKAIITAQKMRLLHAGIRRLVPRYRPEYHTKFGTPVSLEDMLATIMGFSLLVVEGLQALRVPFTTAEAEDYYYVWRVYAQLVGIHPPQRPSDSSYVPADLTEAAEFYRSYARRSFVAAAENPAGVVLARADLDMITDLMPQGLIVRRLERAIAWMFGLDKARARLNIMPRVYAQTLMGRERCQLVEVRPVPLLFVTKLVLWYVPHLWAMMWRLFDRTSAGQTMHEVLTRTVFQGMIVLEHGGEVTFSIPQTVAQARALADSGPASSAGRDRPPGGGVGRAQPQPEHPDIHPIEHEGDGAEHQEKPLR